MLAYLHDAESLDEYYRGMQLFHDNSQGFQAICRYITSVFNFYTASYEPSTPQAVKTVFKDKETQGFLNTFKIHRTINAEERALFFHQEYSKFLEDGIVHPFILDEMTINNLEIDREYNFVLLPDGTIYASLERPGEREYHVREDVFVEAFTYPNHTILSGQAEQVVITAGGLILHQVNEKRLFFISCKSGHFQPTYRSLDHMRTQLAELGVNPCSVISVPDLDMSRAVIKTYNGAKVPVLLTQQDTERLFKIAAKRWETFYREIDREIITALANGDIEPLDAELIGILKKQRAEATYMRSAYHLFSGSHEPPIHFGELVKRFGKLKDAIKNYGTKKFKLHQVQEEASNVLDLINKYDNEILMDKFTPTDDASFYKTFSSNISEIQNLLSKKNLTFEEYHQLKKLSRETGAFFMYMALDAEWKGRGFLIYRSTANVFFQINDLMASADYIYDLQDNEDNEIRAIVPNKIANHLKKYLAHLAIAPPSFLITIDPLEAFWMINHCKDLYFSSKNMSITFDDIVKENDDLQYMEYAKLFAQLKLLKRDAEVARNALIFLDISHQVSEKFTTFIDGINGMLTAVEGQHYEWIKKESENFRNLCFYSPTYGLEDWQCTDQEGFNATLQRCFNPLYDLLNGTCISRIQTKEIIASTQAFRDLMNLNRRNGLFKGDPTKPHLPIVCFDALEEHADDLLKLLEKAIETHSEKISISYEMILHATFILSKVLTQ